MATPTRRRRASRATWVAALALALLTLAACGDEPAELQGYVQDPLLDVGDVSFPSADGDVAMAAAHGELLVVYFGFTSCPDVCPTTLADVGQAIDELDDDDAERVTLGMVTVDPDRDTFAVMTDYLEHFAPDPLALRETDAGELLRDAERFGITYRVEEHEDGDTDYTVEHTSQVFVIDDQGAVRVQWPFEFEREAMVSDLEVLLDEIPAPGDEAAADGDVEVASPWARATAPTASSAAVYFAITSDHDDAIVGVTVDPEIAGAASLHRTVTAGTTSATDGVGPMMSMEEVARVELAAGETVTFEPGGQHVMLTELAAPLTDGSSFELTIELADAPAQTVTVAVSRDEP